MRVQNKVTRKGAQIESFVIGKNPFRLSEFIVVVCKRETNKCSYPYSVEIVTTKNIGNDMDWGNIGTNHWTSYQRNLIEEAGGHTRGYGHIVWEAGFSDYSTASERLKSAMALGFKLVKTPLHLK